jgi:hypothetical protein
MRQTGGPHLERMRIGLYRSWTATSDEGWTRWVFGEWGVPFESLGNEAVRLGALEHRFDAIVVPSMSYAELVSGLPGAHPDYAGGLGSQGIAALLGFVEAGGTLVLLGSSAEFGIRAFELAVRGVESSKDEEGWEAPGSILQVEWEQSHPVSRGLPQRGAVFQAGGAAFEILDPLSVRPIARYTTENTLLSGYARGEDRIAGLAAAVEADFGRGRVVLFGFRPQHRAQTHGTFKALFNALYPREPGG